MRVLVTGCCGFIGSHLADRLILEGHHVWGCDNCVTGHTRNYPHEHDRPKARFSFLNIGHSPLLANLAKECKPDLIIHCAASYKDPAGWRTDTMTNVLGTVEVAKIAQEYGCPVIYFQTALVYGNKPTSPCVETDEFNPESSYAISKAAGEYYLRLSGVKTTVFRLANIIGARNISGPVPTFYKRLLEEQPVTIADTRRDFVYIGDLVDLVMIEIDRQFGGVYHVSTGSDYSISELFDEVRTAMGVNAGVVNRVPRGEDDAPRILLDNWHTSTTYGWEPTTPLHIAVANAVGWYQGNKIRETYTHLALKS